MASQIRRRITQDNPTTETVNVVEEAEAEVEAVTAVQGIEILVELVIISTLETLVGAIVAAVNRRTAVVAINAIQIRTTAILDLVEVATIAGRNSNLETIAGKSPEMITGTLHRSNGLKLVEYAYKSREFNL